MNQSMRTLSCPQQLSTVGALLQLVVHGPGHYSIDESEGEEKAWAPYSHRIGMHMLMDIDVDTGLGLGAIRSL